MLLFTSLLTCNVDDAKCTMSATETITCCNELPN